MLQAAKDPKAALESVLKYVLQLVIVCGTYFVAGRLGLATPFTSGNVSPVWPASGIALAAILLWGYRVSPGIAIGAFLVNFWSPIPHHAAVGLAVGNTLAAVTGAFLLHQIPDFRPSLSRLRDVLGLIVFAAIGSTMVSASIGVAVLFATRVHPWSNVGTAWLMYWLGDGMGVLLVAPLALTFPSLWKIRSQLRLAELTALVLLLSVACFFIFTDRTLFALKLNVLGFAVFPFVIWAAIRFGVSGCALSTLAIAAIGTAATARGSGPFARDIPILSAAMLQLYFAVLAVSGLTLAAVIAERERAENEREQLVREQAAKEAQLQAQQVLQESEKLAATGRLAATIAHEINNPLESLTNLLYLIEADNSLSEAGRRFASAAGQEVKRTAHITKQMLAFHRQSTTPVEISLSEILDNVVELYAAKIEQSGITVQKQYDTAATIEGFPAELRQVFANLLGNAIEAIGQHGVVRLHTFASREWNNARRAGVRVVIADNGVGISPENRRRLFQPFVTTKGERGTGLGLWVTSGIVKKHEGSIRLRSSTRAGRSGTCFSIFLPDRVSAIGISANASLLR
ncbi:MAG TPA: MASE1 domain-containing protein [Terriglobales bacterium]|nr:MASE1 domain-containing protein [Terriglobales bacterium]